MLYFFHFVLFSIVDDEGALVNETTTLTKPIRMRNMEMASLNLSSMLLLLFCSSCSAFLSTTPAPGHISLSSSSTTTLHAFFNNQKSSSSSNGNLTPLPAGISPFEKSLSKNLDIQGSFRKLAAPALQRALQDGVTQLEVEFPPLAGGDQSKSQFDDFDNISELNANRDWCAQWAPTLASSDIWLILPDDKECELAKKEWTGQRYQSACRFTSIRAATTAVLEQSSGGGAEGSTEQGEKKMALAWGSTFASALDKLQGGDGILADSSTLDELDATNPDRLHLVCQPGNGGPVEDWINTKQLHVESNNAAAASGASTPTCIVNGALDKVRDGYYPGVFFPALAATNSFYQDFEAVFFLKPLTDKGQYGWLYRVYPEPWQVILQTPQTVQRGTRTEVQIIDTVALVSEQRPTYTQAVQALVQAASTVPAASN